MRIKRGFEEEVKHRRSQQEYSGSRTLSQRYVLLELRTLFSRTEDQELREKINILERAFQATSTAAVKRELDRLRRNSVTGDHLVDELLAIYQQHRLQDLLDQRRQAPREIEIPRIVCSLAL